MSLLTASCCVGPDEYRGLSYRRSLSVEAAAYRLMPKVVGVLLSRSLGSAGYCQVLDRRMSAGYCQVLDRRMSAGHCLVLDLYRLRNRRRVFLIVGALSKGRVSTLSSVQSGSGASGVLVFETVLFK